MTSQSLLMLQYVLLKIVGTGSVKPAQSLVKREKINHCSWLSSQAPGPFMSFI